MRKRNLFSRVNRRLKRKLFPSQLGAQLFKISHPFKKKFTCPICNYYGPLRDDTAPTIRTYHTHCPKCGSNVRTRLQWLVIEKLRKSINLSDLTIHHFSPEESLSIYFRKVFGKYYSAGITSKPVDCPADLTDLPFADRSCDFIFASHILEHIQHDEKAILEIARVLKQGGIAVLPVPIVQKTTIEYSEPNPNESGHVRAPGLDYFDKYRKVFKNVDVIGSDDFDEKFQLWNYMDLTGYPTKESPLRHSIQGTRHPDYVPICYA